MAFSGSVPRVCQSISLGNAAVSKPPHILRILTAAIALATTAVVSAASHAAPVETGIHKIHASARVGGKLCLVDHFHEQDGAPYRAKRVAQDSAIRQWAVFTSDEYGTVWGNFKAAAAGKVACKQGADKYWTCSASARPCRRAK